MRRKNLDRIVRLAVIISLFQKSAVDSETDLDHLASEDETKSRRIRCPECRWEPSQTSRWYCGECPYPEGFFGGCGTGWNTFGTAGLCPGCGHQWRWTACLRCSIWSLHEDWYTSDDG